MVDLRFIAGGVRITIRRSKTDQDGTGAVIIIPGDCHQKSVTTLQAWLNKTGITSGVIFQEVFSKGWMFLPGRLSDRRIAQTIQTRFGAAKYDPVLFTGHSLQSGFLTNAAETNANV